MHDRSNDRALQRLPGATEPAYEVGYRKPPTHTRFKPGQSGNPLGRPRGAKNAGNRLPALNEERLKTVVIEEAYRPIGIREGDRLIEIPVIQAIIRSVALNAAKGHQRSQRMFAELLQWVERENKALYDQYLNTAIDYKKGWEDELDRRKQRGEAGPEPLPHPDDIVINMQTGQVEIHGPMTKEEKGRWDQLRQHKRKGEELIAEFEEMVAAKPDDRRARNQLRRLRRIQALVAERIPD